MIPPTRGTWWNRLDEPTETREELLADADEWRTGPAAEALELSEPSEWAKYGEEFPAMLRTYAVGLYRLSLRFREDVKEGDYIGAEHVAANMIYFVDRMMGGPKQAWQDILDKKVCPIWRETPKAERPK